jgi:hypothetical protein
MISKYIAEMFSYNFTEFKEFVLYFQPLFIALSSTLQAIVVQVTSQNTLFVPSVKLYTFDESIERSGVIMYTYTAKTCTHCEFGHITCGQELIRKIVSRPDHPRIYPHK